MNDKTQVPGSPDDKVAKTAKIEEVLERFPPPSSPGKEPWLPEPINGIGASWIVTRQNQKQEKHECEVQIRGETIRALKRIAIVAFPHLVSELSLVEKKYRTQGSGSGLRSPIAGESRWYRVANLNQSDKTNARGNKVFFEVRHLLPVDIQEKYSGTDDRIPEEVFGCGEVRVDYEEDKNNPGHLIAIFSIDKRSKAVVAKEKEQHKTEAKKIRKKTKIS